MKLRKGHRLTVVLDTMSVNGVRYFFAGNHLKIRPVMGDVLRLLVSIASLANIFFAAFKILDNALSRLIVRRVVIGDVVW